MNTSNALGFLLLGVTMALWPLLAPQGFPPSGFDGTSTKALWLEVVGGFQVALGAGWLGQVGLSQVADRLATFGMPTLDNSPLPARTPVAQVV